MVCCTGYCKGKLCGSHTKCCFWNKTWTLNSAAILINSTNNQTVTGRQETGTITVCTPNHHHYNPVVTNLTIYLIHSLHALPGRRYITRQEPLPVSWRSWPWGWVIHCNIQHHSVKAMNVLMNLTMTVQLHYFICISAPCVDFMWINFLSLVRYIILQFQPGIIFVIDWLFLSW